MKISMPAHPVDIVAIAGYIAGGGLAGVFIFVGMVFPKYQAIANGAALVLVAVAGLVRVAMNPSPPVGTISANIPVGTEPIVTLKGPPTP
jgi:hypothetical protein